MVKSASDRGASEVVGAVIIFAFLVITFAIYQGVVIPQQNRSVEFEHNQDAQVSLQDLRNAIRQTAASGAEESISITLGASYPQRVLGLNPGVSAGSLQTQSLGSVRVHNVTGTDPQVAEYFGTSDATIGPFETKTITYRPLYMHYSQAPNTSYENSLAFDRFPSGVTLPITDQALVDGRKVSIIVLGGNVSEATQDTVTVDTQAISTATNTVSITDDTGPINITVATRLSASDWTDLLEEEMDPTGTESDKFVSAVKQTGPNQVSILLEPGVTYELKLAKVGVGVETPSMGAKYIVDHEGDGTSLTENGTQQLIVEVRDPFNNPVSNVTVTAQVTTSAGDGDSVSPSTATTDASGRATFTYQAPADVDTAQEADIEASFDGDGTANETVTFDVQVLDADSSGRIERWSPNNTDATVSQPGTIFSSIGNAQHINMSGPTFLSVKPSDGSVERSEVLFRLAFSIERDTTDNQDGETRYLFVVPASNEGFKEDISASGVDVRNRRVLVFEDAALNTDSEGYGNPIVDANLTSSYLNDWYRGDRAIDLLDPDSYDPGTMTATEESNLQSIVDFIMNYDDIDIYFQDNDGRVTMTVE